MKTTFFTLFLLFSFSVSGQNDSISLLKTKTENSSPIPEYVVKQISTVKVVSPSWINQTVNSSGRAISIITAKDIAASNATSIDELLRTVAGINLNTRGGFGVQSDIGIRGATFSQVLIMLDNMRVNDPLTGHFNHILPIALSEIVQIEIIKGPAAVAFGADAVGGMIHIKTKLNNHTSENKTNLTSNGSVAYGQNNLLLSDFVIDLSEKKHYFSISQKTSQSDGQQFVNPNLGKNNQADSLFSTDFNLQTYSAAYGFVGNEKWYINARISADIRDFNAKYFYTASAFDESRETVNSIWTQANIRHAKHKNKQKGSLNHYLLRSLEINLGYRNTKDNFTFNPSLASNIHTMEKFAVNLTKHLDFGKSRSFIIGTQVEQQNIVSTDRGNHQNLNAGIFAVLASEWKKIDYTIGNRLAYNTNFKLAYLPQFSFSAPFKNNKIRIHGSAGRAIRAADFTERFVSSKIDSVLPGRNLGNPDLQEEKSTAIDLGINYQLPKFNISLVAFQRWSSNLIDFSLTNSSEINNLSNVRPNANYLFAKNISSAVTQGIEFSSQYKFQLEDNKSLNLTFNYTKLYTQVSSGILSKYISNHPTDNIGFDVHFKSKDFGIKIEGNYIKRNLKADPLINAKIPVDYILINAKLDYQIKANIAIFGQAINLGDVVYQEILGSPMPRKWLLLGLRWNI